MKTKYCFVLFADGRAVLVYDTLKSAEVGMASLAAGCVGELLENGVLDRVAPALSILPVERKF